MKKNASKNFGRAFVIPLVGALGVLFILIAVDIALTYRAATTVHPLVFGDQRSVQNVTCTGACANVVFVSDQEPGVKYFSGNDTATCSEAMLWANQGREDQVMFGGYMFVDGYQKNLPIQTFGMDVLDGKDIHFTLPNSGDRTFVAHVKETEEWNLLDRVECNELDCDAVVPTRIFTDRDAGRVKLFDSCPVETNATKIFTLYQSPDVHESDTNDTYSVDITRLDGLVTGTNTGGTKAFAHQYSSTDLTASVIHVVADVGEVTFAFDLVAETGE